MRVNFIFVYVDISVFSIIFFLFSCFSSFIKNYLWKKKIICVGLYELEISLVNGVKFRLVKVI